MNSPIEQRKKNAAWEMAKAIVINGCGDEITFASQFAMAAKDIVEELSVRGCFDDKYGDRGSYEVDAALKLFCRYGAFELWSICGSVAFVNGVFNTVREAVSSNAIDEADISRSRVVCIDEEARIALKRESEEQRERERERRIAEKNAIDIRARDIRDRITSIDNELGGNR